MCIQGTVKVHSADVHSRKGPSAGPTYTMDIQRRPSVLLPSVPSVCRATVTRVDAGRDALRLILAPFQVRAVKRIDA